MTMLAENLERLEEAIAEACRRAGCARAEVELMAVSKTYPAATIAEAAALGLTLFGENRVQEFAGKAIALEPLRVPAAGASPIRVHLIGHLQSNKAQRAVELFDGIDSVDSLRLAERLNEAAGRHGKRLPVLVEVKLSAEETKAGLEPDSSEAGAIAGAVGGSGEFADARADDHCSMGRFRGRDTRLLSQLVRVARSLGSGLSETLARCALDGHERRFCAGHRRGRNPDSRGHGLVWRARGEIGAGLMLRATEAGVTLAVRAQPGAKKTAITGVYGEGAAAQLKIAVHAPPLEGRANQALIVFLAETFGVPKNAVELMAGELSRSKVFLLRGVSREKAEAVISK